MPGEQVIRLRSLPLPETDVGLDEFVQVDATSLFVERAEAVGSELRFEASDARPIAEICRRLDGIPLAIELAAARVVALSPSEIAGLLDERFRLLTGGRRASVERHHTLRAAIDWSYSLLPDTERQVFDRLGVFPSTFDAEAAQAVAGEEHSGLGRDRRAVQPGGQIDARRRPDTVRFDAVPDAGNPASLRA